MDFCPDLLFCAVFRKVANFSLRHGGFGNCVKETKRRKTKQESECENTNRNAKFETDLTALQLFFLQLRLTSLRNQFN